MSDKDLTDEETTNDFMNLSLISDTGSCSSETLTPETYNSRVEVMSELMEDLSLDSVEGRTLKHRSKMQLRKSRGFFRKNCKTPEYSLESAPISVVTHKMKSLSLSPKVYKSKSKLESERVLSKRTHGETSANSPAQYSHLFENLLQQDRRLLCQAVSGFQLGQCRHAVVGTYEKPLFRVHRKLLRFSRMNGNMLKLLRLIDRVYDPPQSFECTSDSDDGFSSYSEDETQ